ncbi:uncharacterized protein CTRU02_206480 [Colletotrichum truncatum]|uniref:Uncharacterized protein n=1 Tax=Colletotrichum truncatum TaxID=5467 RepID=A0ACC3Z797_COLTU|nr:uncharacterized protein CTRU02_11853 [Colletotrichum truncatum]KAF6785228.1 hypothetical protein CTRU02_11853 [Colletotrichum truncatum]
MAAHPVYRKHNTVRHNEGSNSSIEQRLGRQLSITPAYLSRVVYIPRHNDTTSHLPLYDISQTYADTTKSEPIGSSNFKLILATMKRPTGDGTDGEVRYLVNFDEEAKKTAGTVERRVPTFDGETANMFVTPNQREQVSQRSNNTYHRFLPREELEHFQISSLNTTHRPCLQLASFYPIPDTMTPQRPVRHPWFTITHETMNETPSQPPSLEWQTHPKEHGAMRYTLVDSGVDARKGTPTIYAIYHHVGIGFDLPHEYSEGILLLSGNLDGEAEILAVTSLLGLLRQVRHINRPVPRPRKKSLIKRVLGRS